MRAPIYKEIGAVVLLPCLLFGCAGSAPSVNPSPSEQSEEVVSVVITPTEGERDGGGEDVVIDARDAVGHWVSSDAFSSTAWERNEDQSSPRYVISFRSRDGEVARYFIGTLKGDSIEYRCFGLCASWWIAPSEADGTQDRSRIRMLTDDVWQPLAREWYLFSK